MKNRTKFALIITASALVFACGGSNEEKQEETATTTETTPAAEAIQEPAAGAGDAEKGKALFADKGCTACHNPENKVVGPAIKDIAAAYTDKSGQIVKFLKEESEAIVDPSQYAVMQASLAITKSMSDQELNDIAAYILSTK
ncbi:MAG: c-type cytochrome [Flavobacteriales bacterium]|nr:c-type cytochrome [Flavobacteriales bacterium]